MFAHRSLRTRILVPLVIASSVAAGLVAVTSWQLGNRWANAELQRRVDSIRIALDRSAFPMTPSVLALLADFTGAQWVAIGPSGAMIDSTLSQGRLRDDDVSALQAASNGDAAKMIDVMVGQRDYRARMFPPNEGRAQRLVVLFDRQEIARRARRAALLPLITGLSTIVLVSALMFLIASRLVSRLHQLETQVDVIASGDFQAILSDGGEDEIGRLAKAISSMASQLDQLWQNVHQQESAKLLHQISAGLAHQLRNTLTGARMAMELHQSNEATDRSDEDVSIAIRQLEIAEEYVQRILSLASQERPKDQAQSVEECLRDIQSTHAPIARHLRVNLRFNISPQLATRLVQDGHTLTTAISNLVINAMQSGDEIDVIAEMNLDDQLHLRVIDNGPGIDPSVAERLFEPFVTTKPEGLGLGLSLVKRSVEHLSGVVNWYREHERTIFEFTVNTFADAR